jgi:hypothetical protein
VGVVTPFPELVVVEVETVVVDGVYPIISIQTYSPISRRAQSVPTAGFQA